MAIYYDNSYIETISKCLVQLLESQEDCSSILKRDTLYFAESVEGYDIYADPNNPKNLGARAKLMNDTLTFQYENSMSLRKACDKFCREVSDIVIEIQEKDLDVKDVFKSAFDNMLKRDLSEDYLN